MGIYKLGTKNRAGWDVDKYDGWYINLIVRDFMENADLTDEYTRTQLRRAILVSYEFNCVNKGVRFSV